MEKKQKLSFLAASLLPVLALASYFLLTPRAANATKCTGSQCSYQNECLSNEQCVSAVCTMQDGQEGHYVFCFDDQATCVPVCP
jgi:hypothetical protein